jgi:hypothetical protein
MSLMFAATYPGRAPALALYGTFASIKDKPWAASRDGPGIQLNFRSVARTRGSDRAGVASRVDSRPGKPSGFLLLR